MFYNNCQLPSWLLIIVIISTPLAGQNGLDKRQQQQQQQTPAVGGEECVASFKEGQKLDIMSLAPDDSRTILTALTVDDVDTCAEFCCEFDFMQMSTTVSVIHFKISGTDL